MCDYFNVLRAKLPHIADSFNLQKSSVPLTFDHKVNLSNRLPFCTQIPHTQNYQERYSTPIFSQNHSICVPKTIFANQSTDKSAVKNPQINEFLIQKVSDFKILSRNNNGTILATLQPKNESELQLYRVLQKANLLEYYNTFISQGGDDVQQLCDAGEEEFLEIMGLVEMKKPLHVRRLQKTLREWMNNPAQFQQPLKPMYSNQALSTSNITSLSSVPTSTKLPCKMTNSISLTSTCTMPVATPQTTYAFNNSITSIPHLISQVKPSTISSIPISGHFNYANVSDSSNTLIPICLSSSCTAILPTTLSNKAQITNTMLKSLDHKEMASVTTSAITHSIVSINSNNILINSLSTSSGTKNVSALPCFQPMYSVSSLNPSKCSTLDIDRPRVSSPNYISGLLLESEIQKIEETAKLKAFKFKDFKFKMKLGKQVGNKKITEKIEYLINSNHDQNSKEWLDQIRQYSAIYGRFCNKRKLDRALYMHEIYVNEAAFQLCRFLPKFLTNRKKLLKEARKVVKKSGYKYSKGHSKSQYLAECEDVNEKNSSNVSSTSDEQFEEIQSCNSSRATSRIDLELLPSSSKTMFPDQLEKQDKPQGNITNETCQKVHSDCDFNEENSNDTVCSDISEKHSDNMSSLHKHYSSFEAEQERYRSKVNNKRKNIFDQDSFVPLLHKRIVLEDAHKGLNQQSQFRLNLTVPNFK